MPTEQRSVTFTFTISDLQNKTDEIAKATNSITSFYWTIRLNVQFDDGLKDEAYFFCKPTYRVKID